jgi:hypothetical protein
MRAVNDALTIRDFVFAIDKDCAFAAQLIDHKTVVDDFLTDVDGRTESLQSDTDNVDGADHARAEAARLQ